MASATPMHRAEMALAWRMLRQTSKRAPHSSPVLRCRSLTSAFRRGVYACVDMCVEHALKIWRVQSSELILANGLSQHLSPHTVHPACARRKWPCMASGLSASMHAEENRARKIEPQTRSGGRGVDGQVVVG